MDIQPSSNHIHYIVWHHEIQNLVPVTYFKIQYLVPVTYFKIHHNFDDVLFQLQSFVLRLFICKKITTFKAGLWKASSGFTSTDLPNRKNIDYKILTKHFSYSNTIVILHDFQGSVAQKLPTEPVQDHQPIRLSVTAQFLRIYWIKKLCFGTYTEL